MQEEDALPESPQWGRAELVPARTTLRDVVRQCAHVVDLDIREQVGSSVAQTRRQVRGLGGERWRMASGAADGAEEPAAVSDRRCSSRRGSGGGGLVQKLHEDIGQSDVTGN